MLQAGLHAYPPLWSRQDGGSHAAGLSWLKARRRRELDGRAVQVGASHRVSPLNVAERDIAGMAQESPDALPHDRFFLWQHP
jgi:hypothetical protein